MSHKSRAVAVAGLVPALGLLAPPAVANHLSDPVGVFCKPGNNEVVVTLQVFGGGAGNSNLEDVTVNGLSAGTIDFGYGIPDGTYTQSLVVGVSLFNARVQVSDGDTTIATTCGASIPALDPMGLLLCAGLLLIAGLRHLRRRAEE